MQSIAQGSFWIPGTGKRIDESWSLFDVLASSTREAISPEDATERATQAVMSDPPLISKTYSSERCDSDCIFFSFVIAGVKEDGRSVANFTYATAPKDPARLLNPFSQTFIGASLSVRCMGQCDAIRSHLRQKQRELADSVNWGDEALSLVQLEIADKPTVVGEPVSLVVISRKRCPVAKLWRVHQLAKLRRKTS